MKNVINVFLFNELIENDIEVSCNLQITNNNKRIYVFLFFYLRRCIGTFEMSKDYQTYILKIFGEGKEFYINLISTIENGLEKTINKEMNEYAINDINKSILIYVRDNYLNIYKYLKD